ncbi:MAG: response regulator transcription factor, partial [Anaerolineae bacterium]|nr:response regulator transcription factor [Anaerolineae bacterium]
MDEQITVLLASDHSSEPEALRRQVSAAPDLRLVASGASFREAINLAALHQPDVVVLDYDTHTATATDTARTILKENAAIQLVMVSADNDASAIRDAMRVGARDYLIRPLAENELTDTIRWLIRERRDYARMQAFVGQLRRAYEALFYDDKPIPQNVIAFLEERMRA